MPPIVQAAAISAGGGILSSQLGKPKAAQPAPTTLESLGPKLEQFAKQQLADQLIQNFNRPQTGPALMRAGDPSVDPFASQGAFDLQKIKDQLGGTQIAVNPQDNIVGQQPNTQTEPTGADLANQFLASLQSTRNPVNPRGNLNDGVFTGDLLDQLNAGLQNGNVTLSGLNNQIQDQGTFGTPQGLDLQTILNLIGQGGLA